MLFLPEINTIFILPPRTGSSTLARQAAAIFPRSFLLYRHMEADGVPVGYESWRKVGFVRHPLSRLWSLYKYCSSNESFQLLKKVIPDEVERVTKSVKGKTFEQWVLTNEETFLPKAPTMPYLYQLHHEPETRKSLHEYLRPDLGTMVLKFQDIKKHFEGLGLNPQSVDAGTPQLPLPKMTPALRKHFKKYFEWELSLGLEKV